LISSNQGLHQLLFLVMMALLVINTQVNRAKAYKLAHSGSQLAPLIFTNLVFSTIWQFVFFQQTFTHQQIFGLSLIVVATMTNSLLPNWLKKQKVKKLHKKVA
ncbi:EamA family transporter, partial [Photobacterium damselae]